jgi:amino acid transporter
MTDRRSSAGGALKHNVLGMREITFAGIGHIAPAVALISTLPVIAAHAGAAMPLSMLLTLIVCFMIANTVAEFSRFMPSTGGYYSFTTRGLGAKAGYVTTWSYLAYDFFGLTIIVGYLGYVVSGFIQSGTGVSIPWWIMATLGFVVVWVLSHYGVKFSTRTSAILGSLELLIMLSLMITFLVSPGHGSSYTAPLLPTSAPHALDGIVGGMVFSVLALSGFEAPAPLAQEAKRPHTFVSRSIMLSLLAVGVFFVFGAYATSVGWGTGTLAAFASNANPFSVLVHRVWGPASWLLTFALMNGAVAGGVSVTNALSRVVLTMGQAGTMPKGLARVHPRHGTPTRAIAIFESSAIVIVLIVGAAYGPTTLIGFLGTICSLAVIVLYFLANIALSRYMYRERRPEARIWRHILIPVAANLLLLPVLYTTVHPVPPYPVNLAPYLLVAWLVLGALALWVLVARHPDALRKGAVSGVDELKLPGSATAERTSEEAQPGAAGSL